MADTGSGRTRSKGTEATPAAGAPGGVIPGVRRRPGLVGRIVLVDILVVILAAAGSGFLTGNISDPAFDAMAVAYFGCCAGVAVLASWLVVRRPLAPLLALGRAIDSARGAHRSPGGAGGTGEPVPRDPMGSVRALVDRIEGGSLELSARLLGSMETDRQRIGRELHDNTAQLVAAALLAMGLAEKRVPPGGEACRESMASARNLLERALDELKVVIYDLRPSMLDDLGLAAAMRWYVQARADRPGLDVITRFDAAAGRLPPHVETALYRIGQEAIANAISHSEATRVEVELEIRPGFAALRVFDDGKGFDGSASRGRGLGLLSMRERAALLGGELNIVTAPGEGTRIYVVVPRPEGEAGTTETEEQAR